MTETMSNHVPNQETSLCCVCIESTDSKMSKITENFIKIGSKFVALREIILNQLNLIRYQVNVEDEIEMKICEICQQVIVSFYRFQLKTQRAQIEFQLPEEQPKATSINLEENEAPLVLHTLDIVRNFVEKYSVQSILEDEDEQRLIIEKHVSFSASTLKQDELIENHRNIFAKEVEDSDGSFMDKGIFLEECKEDDITEENLPTTILEESLEENSCEEYEAGEIFETPTLDDERLVSGKIEFIDRTPEYIVNAYKPSERQSRPKDPDNWIRNKQKAARAKGEEYMTKRGKVREAKRMKSPCKESCRYRCRTKISEEDRAKNFDKYWKLASFILQRKFIFEHHKAVPIQRRRFRNEARGKPRQYSSQYFLDTFNSEGSIESVQVCESMFLRTLDICRNIVAYLHKKVQTGKVQDLRGSSKRKLSLGHEAAIEQIKAHPFFHIENPMPITKMFELYQQECSERGISPVKNHTYRKLFAEYNECEFLKQEKNISAQSQNDDVKMQAKCLQRAKGRLRSVRKELNMNLVLEEHLNLDDEDEDIELL